MKKLFGIGAAVLCSLVVLFTGCSSPSAPSTPSTPEPVLDKIEITTEPTKKEYYTGDSLDLTDMVITATYNNGTTADVTKDAILSGFDSSAATESQTITVTYGGKTATFTVKIKESQPYSFHDTVTALPSGTTGSYGTDATYVEFGDWPQDVVPEADVAGLALDENATTTIERGSFKFVKGTDGNYYVKCAENACSSDYKYNKDNSDVGQIGKTYRWFKVMPIKWRVADSAYDVDGNTGTTTGKLLVAENILTANVPYYESTSDRTIGGSTVYANNYMHSQIRAYLNGFSYQGRSAEQTTWNNKGFLQTAFTNEAINKIITTKVDNSEDSTTDKDGNITKATTYACDPTDDKIFLLSEYEVTKYSKEAYDSYGKGNSRIRVSTDFAKANFAYQVPGGDGVFWWLRSPYYLNSSLAFRVNYNGDADRSSNDVDFSGFGVVPALVISF